MEDDLTNHLLNEDHHEHQSPHEYRSDSAPEELVPAEEPSPPQRSVTIVKIFSREEATTVRRPPELWEWPDIANVMVSDSYKVDKQLHLHTANGDPLQLAYAVNFLETLYARGYAVVQLEAPYA